MTLRQLYNSWLPVQREVWHRLAGSPEPVAAVRAYLQARREAFQPPFRGPTGYTGTVRQALCYRCEGLSELACGIPCRHCCGVGMVLLPYPVLRHEAKGPVPCKSCKGWGRDQHGTECVDCAGSGLTRAGGAS
jgi:hypothetical protein